MTTNHIDEAILVATGEMQKKDYAELLGVDPSRISKMLPEKYEAAIKRLQVEASESQERANQSQALASQLQAEVKSLQAENKQLLFNAKVSQEVASEAQAENKRLQAEKSELQARANNLLAECKQLQAFASRYQGQPPVIRTLASVDARAVMLFLLAAFEGVGSFHLLLHKGFWLALPVSIALAFALLVFTASNNAFGKWFVIVFALAVGGIYFDVFPASWANYLFAFVPPVVAALIAISLKPSK